MVASIFPIKPWYGFISINKVIYLYKHSNTSISATIQ